MATFEIKGLKQLQQALKNAPESAFGKMQHVTKECADIVLECQRSAAPKRTGKGAGALNIVAERTGKGYVYYDVGINSSNWEQTKHLWFHNYGYINHWNNTRYQAHAMWFKRAIHMCKGKVEAKMLAEGRKIIEDVFK